jgi:hypothetical protein
MLSSRKKFEAPRGLTVAIVLLALLSLPAVALAFTGTVTQNSKTSAGSSRLVQMAGTYTLAAGETLVSVYIFTLDHNGNPLSSAHGSSTASTWSAGIGDFALAYYYVELKVATSTGTATYRTPIYAW